MPKDLALVLLLLALVAYMGRGAYWYLQFHWRMPDGRLWALLGLLAVWPLLIRRSAVLVPTVCDHCGRSIDGFEMTGGGLVRLTCVCGREKLIDPGEA